MNSDGEGCPVAEELIGKLYASDKHGIVDIVSGLSPMRRGQLALFCYGRAHLREVGLAVAAVCDFEGKGRAGSVRPVARTADRGRADFPGIAARQDHPRQDGLELSEHRTGSGAGRLAGSENGVSARQRSRVLINASACWASSRQDRANFS